MLLLPFPTPCPPSCFPCWVSWSGYGYFTFIVIFLKESSPPPPCPSPIAYASSPTKPRSVPPVFSACLFLLSLMAFTLTQRFCPHWGRDTTWVWDTGPPLWRQWLHNLFCHLRENLLDSGHSPFSTWVPVSAHSSCYRVIDPHLTREVGERMCKGCSDCLKITSRLSSSCEKGHPTICDQAGKKLDVFFPSHQDTWVKGERASWKKWHLS